MIETRDLNCVVAFLIIRASKSRKCGTNGRHTRLARFGFVRVPPSNRINKVTVRQFYLMYK